jgi:hypothetical protein
MAAQETIDSSSLLTATANNAKLPGSSDDLRLEETLAVSRRIATWSLVGAAVALAASLSAILAHVLH